MDLVKPFIIDFFFKGVDIYLEPNAHVGDTLRVYYAMVLRRIRPA